MEGLLMWVTGLRTTNADHIYWAQLWRASNRTGELKISDRGFDRDLRRTKAVTAACIPGSPFAHIAASTTGALFLGTPHRGTPLADYAVILARAARAFG